MKKKPLHPQMRKFLDDILAFCQRAQCTRTAFGVEAVNDGNFIRSLEEGRMPMFSTIDKVRDYMHAQNKKEK